MTDSCPVDVSFSFDFQFSSVSETILKRQLKRVVFPALLAPVIANNPPGRTAPITDDENEFMFLIIDYKF